MAVGIEQILHDGGRCNLAGADSGREDNDCDCGSPGSFVAGMFENQELA